jgi:hypothetical protein
MSEDDRLDYREMFPLAGRNRKRYSANPRSQKKPEPQGGFFRDEPANPRTKDRVKKEIKPPAHHRINGQTVNADGYPIPSMETVARKMWAKNLDLSVTDVMERLEAMGYQAAAVTISTIKQEMFSVLRLCQKHGSITVHASWGD